MTIETKSENAVVQAVNAAFQHHGDSRDELIPILNEVNHELGYLPAEALDLISRKMKSPRSQMFSVASFYDMLSTKPMGKHIIRFCENAPCHVVGGRQVWQTLKEELNLEADETSPDGKWSLITTSCLGLCSVGPVIVVDDDVYGNLTPDQIPGILARYS